MIKKDKETNKKYKQTFNNQGVILEMKQKGSNGALDIQLENQVDMKKQISVTG